MDFVRLRIQNKYKPIEMSELGLLALIEKSKQNRLKCPFLGELSGIFSYLLPECCIQSSLNLVRKWRFSPTLGLIGMQFKHSRLSELGA